MSIQEFVRRVKRKARERGLDVQVRKHESKGSHRRLYVGGRNATVPWTRDLKKGTVRGILKQLDIDELF